MEEKYRKILVELIFLGLTPVYFDYETFETFRN